jgi:Uma2 family endonuclease
MGDMAELIEAPLSPEELAERFRALCDDPRFANLPGKIELDLWGRIVMSPASNIHSLLQADLVPRLARLGGKVFTEASVSTRIGVLVADVAWLSPATWNELRTETPLSRAPDLCIEIVSPSNSRKELEEKVAAYLAAGALEVWLVLPKSKRVQVFTQAGEQRTSQFSVDLVGLFDDA